MKVYIIEFGFGNKTEKIEKKFTSFLQSYNWSKIEAKKRNSTSAAFYDKALNNM